jgi:hypothetical protein
LEKPAAIGLSDADSRLGDRDLDCIVEAIGFNPHVATLGGELDRVGGEVKQHLFELGAT